MLFKTENIWNLTYIESAMPFETKRQTTKPKLKGDN